MHAAQLACAQPCSSPGGTAAHRPRRPLAVTCQAAPTRASDVWRSQQARRLLLLHVHEHRVAAKGAVAAAAPQQLAAEGALQLEGAAAEQIDALVARLEGDGFSGSGSRRGDSAGSRGNATSSSVNGTRNGKTNGSGRPRGGSSSGSALPAGPAAAASSPSTRAPQLPKPWKQMAPDERRAYLAAVRDFHGEGILWERRLKSGRTLMALVDPRMKPHLRGHLWTERPRGGRAGLFTDTGPRAGRTYLARWTAEECLLPPPGRLPLAVAGWRHKDGCPANCLASNLEVELAPPPPAAAWPEAAAQQQQGGSRARQEARKAVQRLYDSVGPGEARRFLMALHREMLAMAPAQ